MTKNFWNRIWKMKAFLQTSTNFLKNREISKSHLNFLTMQLEFLTKNLRRISRTLTVNSKQPFISAKPLRIPSQDWAWKKARSYLVTVSCPLFSFADMPVSFLIMLKPSIGSVWKITRLWLANLATGLANSTAYKFIERVWKIRCQFWGKYTMDIKRISQKRTQL